MGKHLKEIREALLLSVRTLLLITCFFLVITGILVTLFIYPHGIFTSSDPRQEKHVSAPPVPVQQGNEKASPEG